MLKDEKKLLSRIQSELVPNGVQLVGFQVTNRLDLPVFLSQNEINQGLMQDPQNFISINNIIEEIKTKSEQEKKREESNIQQAGEVKKIFAEFRKGLMGEIDKAEKFVLQRIDRHPNVAMEFVGKFNNGNLNDQIQFKAKFTEMCRELRKNTDMIEYPLETLKENLHQNKFKFNDPEGSVLQEAKVKEIKFLQDGLPAMNAVRGRGLVMHPDKKSYALICRDGSVQVRKEVDDSLIIQQQLELGSPDKAHLSCISYSPDGTRLAVTGVTNRCIYILNAATGDIIKDIQSASTLTTESWRSIWVDNTNIIVGFNINELKLINTESGQVMHRKSNPSQESDGTDSLARVEGEQSGILIGSYGGHLFFVSSQLKEIWSKAKFHKSRIYQISVNIDNTLIVTGSADKSIIVYDLKKKENVFIKDGLEDEVQNITWGPLDRFIVGQLGRWGKILIFSPKTGEIIGRYEDYNWVYSSIVMSATEERTLIASKSMASDLSVSRLVRLKIE